MKKEQNYQKRILAFQNRQHLEYWFRKIFMLFAKMDIKQDIKKFESIIVSGPGFKIEFIFTINSITGLAGYHDESIFYNIEYKLNENLLQTIDYILKGEIDDTEKGDV